MKKYHISGNECTQLEKAQHKSKQLREAYDLLNEFSDRCAWADDFAEYSTIKEAIDFVYTAVEHSKDDLDEEIEQLEERIEDYETVIHLALDAAESESDLQHCLA